MKKKILGGVVLAFAFALTAALFVGCSSTAEPTEEAAGEATEATEEATDQAAEAAGDATA